MMNYWLLYAAVFAFTFISLQLFCLTRIASVIENIALCLLSLIISYPFTKFVEQFTPKEMIPELEERAVFITGCDTGFGNLCAKRLDNLGVTVYAGCLNPEGPGALELKATTSNKLHVIPLDVTKDEDVQNALQYIRTTLEDKVFWAVINNAGITFVGEMEWCSIGDIQRVLDVNLFGYVRIIKAFLPMIRQSMGRIVLMSSVAGRQSACGFGVYSLSKHAVASLVDTLRRELEKWSISVHSIEPVLYQTPLSNKDNAVRTLQNQWQNLPDDIRKVYGESYFREYTEYIKGRMSGGRINLYEVVDSMIDASVGAHPKPFYRPVDSYIKTSQLCPTELRDFLLRNKVDDTIRERTLRVKEGKLKYPPL